MLLGTGAEVIGCRSTGSILLARQEDIGSADALQGHRREVEHLIVLDSIYETRPINTPHSPLREMTDPLPYLGSNCRPLIPPQTIAMRNQILRQALATPSPPTMFTLQDVLLFAQYYLPSTMPFNHCLYILATMTAALPLYRFHKTQMRYGQRRVKSAWLRGINHLVQKAARAKGDDFYPTEAETLFGPSEDDEELLCRDMEEIMDMLNESMSLEAELDDPDDDNGPTLLDATLLESTLVLCTKEKICLFCRTVDNQPVALRRRLSISPVNVITRSNRKIVAHLAVSHCKDCKSNYYPDRITRQQGAEARRQYMLYGAEYIRISKSARLYVHRSLGVAQAQAILQHQTYLGFATWYNRSYDDGGPFSPSLTVRQSQRLFAEHLIRLLGDQKPDEPVFSTAVNPKTEDIVREAVRRFAGSGILNGALEHECAECTHEKRYRDVGAEPQGRDPGVEEDNGAFAVAGVNGANALEQLPLVSSINSLRDLLELTPPNPARD